MGILSLEDLVRDLLNTNELEALLPFHEQYAKYGAAALYAYTPIQSLYGLPMRREITYSHRLFILWDAVMQRHHFMDENRTIVNQSRCPYCFESLHEVEPNANTRLAVLPCYAEFHEQCHNAIFGDVADRSNQFSDLVCLVHERFLPEVLQRLHQSEFGVQVATVATVAPPPIAQIPVHCSQAVIVLDDDDYDHHTVIFIDEE